MLNTSGIIHSEHFAFACESAVACFVSAAAMVADAVAFAFMENG